jgi:hypothetical protein
MSRREKKGLATDFAKELVPLKALEPPTPSLRILPSTCWTQPDEAG